MHAKIVKPQSTDEPPAHKLVCAYKLDKMCNLYAYVDDWMVGKLVSYSCHQNGWEIASHVVTQTLLDSIGK